MLCNVCMASRHHNQPKGGFLMVYPAAVSAVNRQGCSPHAPHVYVESDLQEQETLVAWRKRQAAERAQSRRMRDRVLASLVRK